MTEVMVWSNGRRYSDRALWFVHVPSTDAAAFEAVCHAYRASDAYGADTSEIVARGNLEMVGNFMTIAEFLDNIDAIGNYTGNISEWVPEALREWVARYRKETPR